MIGKEPAKGEGLAPSNLLSSTIGGELVISNNGQSRMFSVSIKDHGAVLPGGHTGKAFWYSKSDGSFTSSTYYLRSILTGSHSGMRRSLLTNTKTPSEMPLKPGWEFPKT